MTNRPEMSKDERDMRRSFRIREHAFINVKELSDSEYANVLESRSLQKPSEFGNHARLVNLEARFQESFALLGTASSPVRDCLKTLNEKITLLFDEQPDRQQAIRQLTEGTAKTCEIGSTGVRFDYDSPLADGTKLFLQIMLTSDRHYLETAAVVRRQMEPLNGSNAGFGVAVEFVGFSEAESELLIKHLFQRESQSLRMRRLELGD